MQSRLGWTSEATQWTTLQLIHSCARTMAYFLYYHLRWPAEADRNLNCRHGHPFRASEFCRHCAGHFTTIPSLFRADYSDYRVDFSEYAHLAARMSFERFFGRASPRIWIALIAASRIPEFKFIERLRAEDDISNLNCIVYDFESNYLDLEIRIYVFRSRII